MLSNGHILTPHAVMTICSSAGVGSMTGRRAAPKRKHFCIGQQACCSAPDPEIRDAFLSGRYEARAVQLQKKLDMGDKQAASFCVLSQVLPGFAGSKQGQLESRRSRTWGDEQAGLYVMSLSRVEMTADRSSWLSSSSSPLLTSSRCNLCFHSHYYNFFSSVAGKSFGPHTCPLHGMNHTAISGARLRQPL